MGDRVFILRVPTGYGKTVILNILSEMFDNPKIHTSKTLQN